MALPATDTFMQTSGSTQTLTAYSANWAMSNGVMNINSGAGFIYGSATLMNCGRWVADSFNADHYAIAQLNSNPGWRGPAVRCQSGSANWYHIACNATEYYLERVIAGSATALVGPLAITGNAGDWIKLEVEGTGATVTLRVYRAPTADPTNFSLIGTHTDTSGSRITAGGAAGIWIYAENDSVGVGAWEGGNLAGAAGTSPKFGRLTGSVLVNSSLVR